MKNCGTWVQFFAFMYFECEVRGRGPGLGGFSSARVVVATTTQSNLIKCKQFHAQKAFSLEFIWFGR